MRIIFIVIVIIMVITLGISAYFLFSPKMVNIVQAPSLETPVVVPQRVDTTGQAKETIDFSKINPEFLFSAEIAQKFEIDYTPQLKAINIYNPNLEGQNNTEKSQIYITYFKADRFLTLSTVDITQRDPIDIKGHEAILYEITKKPGVPNFSGQPSWRNFKHKAIDIRLSEGSPTYFYSFAYNPNLGTSSSQASTEKAFNNFIDSLEFYSEK